MSMRTTSVLVIAATLAALVAVPASAKTVSFAGYTWEVRSGQGGPGPNAWSTSNAWVDATGALHLRIARIAGKWQCAEVYLDQAMGFGTYEFNVTGPIDLFDRNIVLGLFDYPTPDVGPDGTNEIDVEFSHWGNLANPIGNYTVWPAVAGPEPGTHTFAFALPGAQSTHRFTWASDGIVFSSFKTLVPGSRNPNAKWNYHPANPSSHVPQQPLPVHLNLWLFQGNAPSDGKPVEIVINGFHFTPQ